MRTLTIEAKSPETAQELVRSLSAFSPRMSADEHGRCRVEVALGERPDEIIAVLNAIERYVVERQDGPARVHMDGASYLLEG